MIDEIDVFFEEGPEEVSVLVAKRRLERCLQILDSIPTPSKVSLREAADLVAADLKENTGH